VTDQKKKITAVGGPETAAWPPLVFLVCNAVIFLAAGLLRPRVGPSVSIEEGVQIVSPEGAILPAGSVVFVLLASAALLLYLRGYACAHLFSRRLLALGFLLFSVMLLATPPLLSTDLYTYAMRGRVLSVHHANPYLQPGAGFPDDPFLRFAVPLWNVVPQNYGPLETCIEALLTALGGDNPSVVFMLFKLWGLLGTAVGALLIAGLGEGRPEADRKRTLFLFAWNPLILIEFVNHAHNDIWMIVLGLAALRLHRAKKEASAAACLVLGGLIKYIYWLLLPLFLVDAYREGRLTLRKLVGIASVCAVLMVAFYAPFWEGLATFGGVIAQAPLRRPFYQYGPAVMAGAFAVGPQHVVPEPKGTALVVLAIVMRASQGLFALLYGWQTLSRRSLPARGAAVLILFALVASGTVLPWYTSWWIPLLILEDRHRAAAFWTAISLGAYFLFYSTTFSLFAFGVPLALVATWVAGRAKGSRLVAAAGTADRGG
jgi:hypothetical protein